MKFTAALLLLASLARECTSNCLNVEVFAKDEGAWAATGLTNDAVRPNLAGVIAAVPYLCAWENPFLTSTESLKLALSQPVAILIALAVSDKPVWTVADRRVVKEAMFKHRLGYLMVYDWISYVGTTDRLIPGLPATFVSPGHAQSMSAAHPGTPPSKGRGRNITSIVSPACWTTTGSISNGISRRQKGTTHFLAPYFYGQGRLVGSVVDFVVPKAKVRVYYSTAFLWVFLTGQSAQPDWCLGNEPADSMIELFKNELTYVAERLTEPLISVVDTTPECPEIVATKSWVPGTKKFFPLNLIQDPDDPEDLGLTISVTGCLSSEPGKKKRGRDCHVDEIDESLIYIRASKDHDVGRLYAVSYFATNDAGLSCTGVVYACVPYEAAVALTEREGRKPDGKMKYRSCPTPDEIDGWTENLEDSESRDRGAWDVSGTTASASVAQTGWQWSVVVGLAATTLVVAISTLATICFQMRSNWLTLKEEAFASALVMSPCQVQHASPTPAV